MVLVEVAGVDGAAVLDPHAHQFAAAPEVPLGGPRLAAVRDFDSESWNKCH
jgi:hypothetical protein